MDDRLSHASHTLNPQPSAADRFYFNACRTAVRRASSASRSSMPYYAPLRRKFGRGQRARRRLRRRPAPFAWWSEDSGGGMNDTINIRLPGGIPCYRFGLLRGCRKERGDGGSGCLAAASGAAKGERRAARSGRRGFSTLLRTRRSSSRSTTSLRLTRRRTRDATSEWWRGDGGDAPPPHGERGLERAIEMIC